jgi:hypothetical protein
MQSYRTGLPMLYYITEITSYISNILQSLRVIVRIGSRKRTGSVSLCEEAGVASTISGSTHEGGLA